MLPLALIRTAVSAVRSVLIAQNALVVIGFGLGLASCTALQGYPEDPVSIDSEVATLRPYFGPDLVARYESSTDPLERRQIRDSVVYGRIRAYDLQFDLFERDLFGGSNGVAAGSDLAVLALDGAASVTGGASLKAALAAASTGIVGARGAINKDLFYERTVPALLAQIEANRNNAKVNVLNGLKQSDLDYPLQRALLDLDSLRSASGLPQAISTITQTASNQSKASEAAVADTLAPTPYAQSASGELIAHWLYATDASGRRVLNKTNRDSMRAWLDRAFPATPIAIGNFLHTADYEPQRQAAIQDLRIR